MANPISDILSQMELVNGCKIIDKSYIESERMLILKLEGQEMIATITEDLVKSLHAMIGDEQNHLERRNEMINGYRLVDTSYDENLQMFALDLGIESVTMSKHLVKSLREIIDTRNDLNHTFNSV